MHGNQPAAKARMSVSLNTTTNIAYFYGGRTETSQSQPANYVIQKKIQFSVKIESTN